MHFSERGASSLEHRAAWRAEPPGRRRSCTRKLANQPANKRPELINWAQVLAWRVRKHEETWAPFGAGQRRAGVKVSVQVNFCHRHAARKPAAVERGGVGRRMPGARRREESLTRTIIFANLPSGEQALLSRPPGASRSSSRAQGARAFRAGKSSHLNIMILHLKWRSRSLAMFYLRRARVVLVCFLDRMIWRHSCTTRAPSDWMLFCRKVL